MKLPSATEAARPKIGITAITPFIAGRRTALDELPGYAGLSAAAIEHYRESGIKTLYSADEHTSYSLARGAAEQLLTDAGIEASALSLVIFIKGRVPDQLVASEATRLQHDLSAKRAQVMAVSDLGCADSTVALKLAWDHLLANRASRHVLICYGHRNPEGCRFREPVTVQGDGGFACLVSKSADGCRLLDQQFESNGAFWDLFKIDYEGKSRDELRETCRSHRAYGFELAVESQSRFDRINREVLGRQGLAYSDIKHVILQNISSRAYLVYADLVEGVISPVCAQNLDRYGHLGCADVFLNLQLGLETGVFAAGDHVLIMNNSPAAAWTTFLVRVEGTS